MSNTRIARISCPPDELGNPIGVSVGFDNIVRIEQEDEDLGTYKIAWFVGYDEQDRKIVKLNALTVQTVVFKDDINHD